MGQKLEIIMETNRLRARAAIILMDIAPALSWISAPAAFAVLWAAWKIGEGQYRINGGVLRPLSREIIERGYFTDEGVDSEVWVPAK
jgi:hypothetical protein